MADDDRHMPMGEFRELGFLQEANRLFFHPLGLALEVVVVDEPQYALVLSHSRFARLWNLICAAEKRFAAEGHEQAEVVGRLREDLERARRYEPGDAYLSGVWDYRDDPEGLVFGDELDVAKAVAVADLRAQHFSHRTRLFAGGERIGRADGVLPTEPVDVQPIGWLPPKEEQGGG